MSALTRDDRPNRVRSAGIAMAVDGTMNGAFNFVTNRTWILLALPSPFSSFIFIFVSSHAFYSARLRRKRSPRKEERQATRKKKQQLGFNGFQVSIFSCPWVLDDTMPFGSKRIGY